MDRLSALLAIFQPETRQVRTLALSETYSIAASNQLNRLYLVAQTAESVILHIDQQRHWLTQHSLVWLPHGRAHALFATPEVELTQIEISFGDGVDNPLLKALPEVICIEQHRESTELQHFFQLMLSEAQAQRCGHHTVLNRLAEVLLVKILRHLMVTKRIETGVLGALSDPKLAKAMTAMHQSPDQPWTLSSLAHQAGMSRTGFSQGFKAIVGATPMEYLTYWRMQIARQQLQKGLLSIDEISSGLGYQSETAFRRAFRRTTGAPPSLFKKSQTSALPAHEPAST